MKKINLIVVLAMAISIQVMSQDITNKLENFLLDEPDSVLFEKVDYLGKESYHLKKLRKQNKDKGSDAAYLKSYEFTNGTIECDIASTIFTGIAFRAVNGGKFECIYFRPFNSGSEKHENTVQYVAKGSKYTWHYLRNNFPGKYEAGASIEKNKWFHVKLDIKDSTVKVFINESKDPVLIVNDLKYGISKGSVGFWSWDGYFANLKITND